MNDLRLKEENSMIKELFNFNVNELQMKHLIEIIQNLNGSNYFIQIMSIFSSSRPNQPNVSKKLIECVCSYFPEQINEIQQKQIYHISRRTTNKRKQRTKRNAFAS